MFEKIRRRDISALEHALAVEHTHVKARGGKGYGKLTDEECEKLVEFLQSCLLGKRRFFLTDTDIKTVVGRYQAGKCPICDEKFKYDGGTSYCPECRKEWHEGMILKYLIEVLDR